MSTFIQHIEERYADLVTALDLSQLGAAVLHALVTLDLQGSSGEDDEHGRQGVISWRRLVERTDVSAEDLPALESDVDRLADWGVIQVVGRHPSDPILLGSAAVRLSHPGRAALGLAPSDRTSDVEIGEEVQPWVVMHSHSREALWVEAQRRFGVPPGRVLIASAEGQGLMHLCGTITAIMMSTGAVVVDGFELSEQDRARVLPELLRRTARARLPRVLLTHEPSALRLAAIASGALMQWIETDLHTKRGSNYLDRRVTDALVARSEGKANVADIAGVPGTDVATPRRVHTLWEDLVVPKAVQTQLEQAKMHAAFRLNTLPTRKGFKGGGYRLLMSGLPGTGKSMAAEALATSLNKPVVKLDLSSVLSKWLGETESLIGQVFDLAEASGAVLVLDEAEALFRQRKGGGAGGSDALMTAVAFLLTRLDRFEGVLVATTNRTSELDDAFFRRFDDFIVLPMPDEETRHVLWSMFLPCGRPDRSHSNLTDAEMQFLAKRFVLSGGLIRGAAIRANGWSEGMKTTLSMPIVLGALARELEKADRSSTEVLVEPYRSAVAELLNERRLSDNA
jgi:hypothetical protein